MALTRTPRSAWIEEGMRALADGGPESVDEKLMHVAVRFPFRNAKPDRPGIQDILFARARRLASPDNGVADSDCEAKRNGEQERRPVTHLSSSAVTSDSWC